MIVRVFVLGLGYPAVLRALTQVLSPHSPTVLGGPRVRECHDPCPVPGRPPAVEHPAGTPSLVVDPGSGHVPCYVPRSVLVWPPQPVSLNRGSDCGCLSSSELGP